MLLVFFLQHQHIYSNTKLISVCSKQGGLIRLLAIVYYICQVRFSACCKVWKVTLQELSTLQIFSMIFKSCREVPSFLITSRLSTSKLTKSYINATQIIICIPMRFKPHFETLFLFCRVLNSHLVLHFSFFTCIAIVNKWLGLFWLISFLQNNSSYEIYNLPLKHLLSNYTQLYSI